MKRMPTQPKRVRLSLECLEGREVPAVYTAANVPELIGAITAANQSAEADTIALAAGATFTLKDAYGQSYYAMTGLPPITAAGGPLTLVGNGDIIERSTAKKVPAFRLVTVEAGADLTLTNLTLQGGLVASAGGGIYNAGTLALNGVTVQRNTVRAGSDSGAAGGGIYSIGQLTLQDCLVQNNQVIGGDGSPATQYYNKRTREWDSNPGQPGGWGLGGGVYVASGTATMLNTTVTSNTAQGGKGGEGRYGLPAGADGQGRGGGICINAGVSATLDAFTVAHAASNLADLDPNIAGSYTIVP
jgi:hypothetical protein